MGLASRAVRGLMLWIASALRAISGICGTSPRHGSGQGRVLRCVLRPRYATVKHTPEVLKYFFLISVVEFIATLCLYHRNQVLIHIAVQLHLKIFIIGL